MANSIEANEHRLYTALGGFGRHRISTNPKIKELVDNRQQIITYPSKPNANVPVKANEGITKYA